MNRFRGCAFVLLVLVALSGCGPGPQPSPPPVEAGWLSTAGNHIVDANGNVWVGRGANLQDTRSCGSGTAVDGTPLVDNQTGLAEVKRRIDALVDDWHASFIRLTLESRRAQDSYVNDATYRALIRQIVAYIGTKPGVYVLVSLWIDPSLDAQGWPTDSSNQELAQLAADFYDSKQVLFGVSNEPEANYDGALDGSVWARMNSAVQAIRDVEKSLGPNRHIITVQGTRDWARDLSYYATHPITAEGGINVAYETHVYNSPEDFDAMFVQPGQTLPVVIGEFGPVNDAFHKASVSDMQTLIDKARAAGIPHLAWTFHQYCSPNLIGSQPDMTWDQSSTDTDGLGMPLNPTDFGLLLKRNLQAL